MYIKRFNQWNKVKKKINNNSVGIYISKREIRWCVLGVNIGSEIDGKGNNFTRPILIVDILGKNTALVVPITSKHKNIPGRYKFKWKNNINSLCINQIKIISMKRILDRKGKISENKLQEVKNQIKEFYNF